MKLSTKKLIISGNIAELYEYERPYAYNIDPISHSSTFGGDVDSLVPSPSFNPRRDDNLLFVRSTIRRLVDSNVDVYGYEPVFLTFTFAQNICDVDIANKHFTNFIKRLNFHYGKKFIYLSVVEFQKRGAVHYHAIFFNMPLEIEREERRYRTVANIWGHGFIDIERIRSAKRVGPYVCKYLDKAVHDSRLIGKKAFFTSRGLVRPKVFRVGKIIDEKIRGHTIKEVLLDTSYKSEHFGLINYKQYVFNKSPCSEI